MCLRAWTGPNGKGAGFGSTKGGVAPPPPLQPPKLSNTPRSHTLAGGGPRAGTVFLDCRTVLSKRRRTRAEVAAMPVRLHHDVSHELCPSQRSLSQIGLPLLPVPRTRRVPSRGSIRSEYHQTHPCTSLEQRKLVKGEKTRAKHESWRPQVALQVYSR